MRRILDLLLMVSFLGTAAGCSHLCGICDCEPERCPCTLYGLPGSPSILRVDPVKVETPPAGGDKKVAPPR